MALIERNGWELVDVFTDNSVSAWSGRERPAWKRLLAACADGRVDVVIAWRDDRLWRSALEQQVVTAMLLEHGVQEIATANGKRSKLGDADDRVMAGIGALMAEAESARKSDRVKRKLAQLAEGGRWRGGPRPYGYRSPEPEEVQAVTDAQVTAGVSLEPGKVFPGGLVVVPEEADVLRNLASRALAGEPIRALTRELNEREVPSASGGTWRTQTLRGMLVNPIYAGLNRFRGEVIGRGRWEPIIDRQTYEALSGLLAARSGKPGRPPRKLLSGLLTCYRCGSGLSHTVRRGDRRYTCRASKADGSCGGPSVSAEPAEDVVARQVLAALSESDTLARRFQDVGTVDVAGLSQQITADEERLNRLIADHYKGDVPKAAYLTARRELEARIDGARQEISKSTTATFALDLPWGSAEALAQWWEDATVPQKRTLLDGIIERVELKAWDRATMGRKFSDDRIEIVWRY